MQADYILDYDVIATARQQRLYVLARIKAGPAPHAAERRPLNLSVVLDRSGSMAGEKVEYVKQAARFLVQRLGVTDRFCLVTYNQTVKVDVPPTAVTHKDLITQSIEKIKPAGTTNLSGGWLQGCQLVAEGAQDGQINRVLLLTDGLANEGVTNPTQLEALARQKRAEGITTTTMGVGMDFNEDLLTRMAAEGGGAFYFIDEPDQTPKIFAEELQDLLSVVGQNLTITLTLSPDVQMVTQLNAYPADVTGNRVTFRLGDLFADEIKTLLLELAIPALKTLGQVQVGQLRFEYDELSEDSVIHRTQDLPIMVNTVAEADFAGRAPNADVVKSALLLRAARAREESVQHADSGDFVAAQEALSRVADEMEQHGLDDPDLQNEYNMLREEAVDMELGSERYDSHTRKASTTKSFYTAGTRVRRDETVALHTRLKMSRQALERHGKAPTLITWRDHTLPLSGDEITIGRSSKCDIVIAEEEVSARHCRIFRRGDDLLLEDLNSTNGTFANGGRVQGAFRLSVGDVVTVGSYLFILREA